MLKVSALPSSTERHEKTSSSSLDSLLLKKISSGRSEPTSSRRVLLGPRLHGRPYERAYSAMLQALAYILSTMRKRTEALHAFLALDRGRERV